MIYICKHTATPITTSIVLCVLSMLLISCDPIVMLMVQPVQKTNTRFRFVVKNEYQQEDSVLTKRSLGAMPNRKEIARRITRNITTQSDSLERVVLFNYGSWKEHHFSELSAVIDTLVISDSSTTKTFADSAQVYFFLKSKPLSGLFNHMLSIP